MTRLRLRTGTAALARDLRAAGLRRGDIIELHVSLKSLGHVTGGACAVVRAFQAVLGRAGTLLMPAFSYCWDNRKCAFAPQETPVRVGAVAEAFRSLPDVVRSFCPIHSVAAWGLRAAEFTRGHPLSTTLGVGSPFHLAAQAGGKIVLLGCGQTSNSFLHVAESLAGHPMIREVSPYGGRAGLVRQADGQIKRWEVTEFTGCSKGFGRAEDWLAQRGLIRRATVGAATAQVMSGTEVLQALVPYLRRHPDFLLCPAGCKG